MRYLRWRRMRYAAPAIVLAAIGVVAAVPALSGASSPAGLPALSAQQILADVVAAKPPQLTGSLEWTANLGFSGLSALEQEAGQGGSGGSGGGGGGAGDGSFDPLNLLSGNYQLNVWLDGDVAEHVA